MPLSTTMQKAIEHANSVFSWTVGGMTPADSPDKPDYVADWYQEQIEDVDLMRTVYGGTKAMRAAKDALLPQHPAEDEEDYETRLGRAVLYNATKRTVGGLVGMVFRKDPVLLDDVPPVIAEHAENIDLQGRHLAVFARDLFTANMIDGHSYIHVEFPSVDPSAVRVAADERRAGVRPYWTHISKSDAINARWKIVNGEPVLNLFVYRETATVDVGEYGQDTVTRYRVLRPGSFEVWEKVEGKNEYRLFDSGTVSLDYIPVVASYVTREGIFRSTPPLIDMVYENIKHWQLSADLQHALTLSCFPIMFAKGFKDDAFRLGPNYGLRTENDLADAKWIEPEGSSIDKVENHIKSTEARMASLGLQMLVRETRQAETAQAKIIDKSESDSALSASARALGDSLENALAIHADYLSLGKDAGGSVFVNDDFRDQEMTPDMIRVLSDEVERNHISIDTYWERLVEGEVLDEDFDTEAERAKIDAQAMEKMIEFVEARERGEMGNGGPPVGPVPPEYVV